jgi:hypothetical protein
MREQAARFSVVAADRRLGVHQRGLFGMLEIGRQVNIVAVFNGSNSPRNNDMNAQELADKFTAKIAVAAVEKNRQTEIAAENVEKRTADVEHCKRAMEQQVLPFLEELKHLMGDQQFSFAPQIELNDHRPVGVSFKVGDGAPTTITTAFGNIVVTRIGDSGTLKGVPFVYAPDVEPYISNSGDLTRDKIAKLVEMVIDTAT